MKLLIIGAGGHGRCAFEIAKRMNRFDEISFIDDNYDKAIGKISDLPKYIHEYDCAFIAIGNNKLREELNIRIKEIGYKAVNLIDPLSFISSDAVINEGCIFFPFSVVESNSYIGNGTILCSNVVVNHDAFIDENSLIYSNSTIRPNTHIGKRVRVGSNYLVKFGEVVDDDLDLGEF